MALAAGGGFGLPASYGVAREELRRVAAHVLGRRRHQVAERFGLRVTPGGFGTPAFGDDEVLRLVPGALVHERDGRTRVEALAGATLADLARLVGADLDRPFSAGGDTPPLGDRDAPLRLRPEAVGAVTDWYALGAAALDAVLVTVEPQAMPSIVQLWPEHFDLACDVAYGRAEGRRVNLGASPGDAGIAEPYLYVGPWDGPPEGAAAFWNASFGATLRRSQLHGDPVRQATEFFRRGLTLLDARD